MRKLLVILGTPIDDVNMDEALQRVQEFVHAGRETGKTHQIATVNADFVVKALHDPKLRQILQRSDMATADGMPLVWGARRLGVPMKSRVTGVDLVPAIAAMAAEQDFSVYFLGAAPGVAQQAADILCKEYPSLNIAGIAAPGRKEVDGGDPKILEDIRKAKPDILMVAFGNPKQEKWIDQYADELDVPVMMGVGGSFDFIAGVTKRAPDWMQKTGLEWLHRLVHEPRRLWKRYAVDLVNFSYFFLWQWWFMRKGQSVDGLPIESEMTSLQDTPVFKVQGRLDASNQRRFAERANQTLDTKPYLIVNLADAEFLDSTAIGTLVALTKQARDAGGNLWLVSVPASISQVLSLLRLEQFFEICDDIESALADCRTVRSLSMSM